MAKKISVHEFISSKKLEKIEKIIEKSANVEDTYDKIENLLMQDFKVKDLGTNRLVLIHKKHKEYMCKVAGDSHGIEANYREFYNGDLNEKGLTKSYSISENGVFLVQEKVTPFDSKMMNKKKKEVRKMLSHLEDKLLLVDCKLSNFKNFGIRKNGDIVLLDHGDTIPLTMYENGEIVNIVEESNVSLRCKEYKKGTSTSKNPKPCDGKLVYSENYDYFICKRCKAKMPIHNAYREFYANSKINIDSGKMMLNLEDGFDPEEYRKKVQKSIQQYAKDTMKKYNIEEKEIEDMEKHIKGQKCTQIRGFWIPRKSDKPMATAKFQSLKRGDISPVDYLKFLGLNPDDYKMNKEDHQDSKKNKEEYKKNLDKIVKKLVTFAGETNDRKGFVDQEKEKRNGVFRVVRMSQLEKYFENVREERYAINKALKFEDIEYSFFDEDNFYVKLRGDKDLFENNPILDPSREPDFDGDVVVEKETSSNDKDEVTSIPFTELCKMDVIDIDDQDCVEYQGYNIPLDVVNKYYNSNNATFDLPSAEKILDDNGYDLSDYVIDDEDKEFNNIVNVDEEETDTPIPMSIPEFDNESDEEIDESEESDDDIDILDETDGEVIDEEEEELRKQFIDKFISIMDRHGYDRYGYVVIERSELEDIMTELSIDEFYLDEDRKLNDDGINYLYSMNIIEVFGYHDNKYTFKVIGKSDIVTSKNDDILAVINKFNDDIFTDLYTMLEDANQIESYPEQVSNVTRMMMSLLSSCEVYDDMPDVFDLIPDDLIDYDIVNQIDIDDLDFDSDMFITRYVVEMIGRYINWLCDTQVRHKIIDLIDENKELIDFSDSIHEISTLNNLVYLRDEIFADYLKNDESVDEELSSEEINEKGKEEIKLIKPYKEALNNTIKEAIKSLDIISFNMEDIKDKTFEVINELEDGTTKVAHIDLYDILKVQMSS